MSQDDPDRRALRNARLTAMYQAHRAELVARLRRVFGAGPPHPDDLAQTAFAKLSELSDLDEVRNPRAFLFRLAVNAGLDQVDRSNTARRFQKDYTYYAETLQNQSPERVYLEREQLDRLERLIAKLPRADRDLLHRSRLEGETLAAIAKDSGMSVATASRRIARILSDLQAEMRRQDRDGAN